MNERFSAPIRHIPPGRCLLRQPFQPGEVQRIPRAARQFLELVGYHFACPSCGLRGVALAAHGFREGPPLAATVHVENEDGELRPVTFLVPSGLETSRPIRCLGPRCGVVFHMRGGLMCMVSCVPMHHEKHRLLADLDERAAVAHAAKVAAWQEARKKEIQDARAEGRAPALPAAPTPPQSVRDAVLDIATRHGMTVDALVHGFLTGADGAAFSSVPPEVREPLFSLRDVWEDPPAAPVWPEAKPKPPPAPLSKPEGQ